MEINSKTKAQFIAVAAITSELSAVVTIAKEISLAAANAKAIAFRAGDKARGFQPITDYISDLAKETIARVGTIDAMAIKLFQDTVNEYRKIISHQQFNKALTLAGSGSAEYAGSLLKPLNKNKAMMQECQRQFKREVQLLLNQLEEVMAHAQTARVIATYSRIEASQSGEYLQSLQAVAQNVDNAAHIIHDNVQRCIMALSLFRSETA
jgi:methyl-accepting chemotaxis protein